MTLEKEEHAHLRLAYDPSAKVAVTGSTGYIGSSLIKSGRLSLQPVNSLHELPSGCVIIHLAAATLATDRQTLLTNINIDSLVLSWAADTGSRVVYASGNNVYGKALDCRIEEIPRVSDYYSASKIFGEMMGHEKLGLDFLALRIGDVFGAGQRHGALFQAIERSISETKPLRQIGEGLKLRSYIYIRELILQIAHAADLLRQGLGSGAYNIAHSEPRTVRQLLEELSRLTGLTIEHFGTHPDDSHLDVRTLKTTALPRYTPTYTMDSALKDYVASVRSKI